MTKNLSGQIGKEILNAKFILEQSLTGTITKTLHKFELKR